MQSVDLMKLPDVTYVLVSYNHESYVEEALVSAFNQDYKGKIHYLVIDDQSKDKSRDKIREVIEKYSHLCVDDISPNTNMGVSSNLNRAIALAKSEIIILQACDDVALPNRVSVFVKAFLDNPDLKICSFNVVGINAKGDLIDNPYPVDFKGRDYVIPSLKESNFFGCNEALKKEVWEKYGGLSSSRQSAEDKQLVLMGNLTPSIKTFPQITLKYRRHDSNWSNLHRVKENWRSREIRAKRHAESFYITGQALFEILNKEYKINQDKGSNYREMDKQVRIWANSRTATYLAVCVGGASGLIKLIMLKDLSAKHKFMCACRIILGRLWYLYQDFKDS